MNLPRPSHGDNILQRVKFNTICGRTIFAAVIMVISVLRSMHLFKLGYIISGQWLVVMATKSVPSYTLDDSSHYYEQLHLQFAPHTCFSQATSWSPDKSQGQACLHCLQGRGFMCWWRRVKVAQWMWHVAPPHVPRVTSYGAVWRTTADTWLDARQETDARRRCPWFDVWNSWYTSDMQVSCHCVTFD